MRATDWARPATEAELCDRFAVLARRDGWTVYPETCDFDLLLVASDGVQVGVQAKLRPNVAVLAQAAPRGGFEAVLAGEALDWMQEWPGPDHRAVLVPEATSDFTALAGALRLKCFRLWSLERRGGDRVLPGRGELGAWPLWPYTHRLELPDFAPDVPAGVPSPRQMTRWRIAAIRLCKVLRERGWICIYDFRTHGLAPGIWVDKWVVWQGDKTGGGDGYGARPVRRYVPKPGARLPDEDFPARAEGAA